MKNLSIHIIKHGQIGLAEEILIDLIKERGHEFKIVDPRSVVSSKFLETPDVVISRCELDDCKDKLYKDYIDTLERYDSHFVPVVNRANFVTIGQDKYLSYLAVEKNLKQQNLSIKLNPETYLANNRSEAIDIGNKMIEKFGSFVIKPPCSGRGKRIRLVSSSEQAREILPTATNEYPLLVQQVIDKERNEEGGYRDIRVWVCRDSKTNKPVVVSAYYRNAPFGSFITNIDQGGYVSKVEVIDKSLVFLSVLVMEATGGDIAGIDFARDIEGNYWFEEINVAFETGTKPINLLGDLIWRKALDFIESKIS